MILINVVEWRLGMKELRIKLFDTSRTLKLMDEFEGIGEDNKIIYDRLVIYNQNLLGHLGEHKVFNYALIVERGKSQEAVGSITMTDFKSSYLNPFIYVTKSEDAKITILKEHIENEVTESVYNEYVDSGNAYIFSAPYKLKAQNSRNRSGYGNIYNGDILVYEGTKYGETSSYLIVGVYIYKSDGLWGHYDNKWGEVKPRY